MRLLIADDEPLALRRLAKLLEEAGCQVVAELPDGEAVMEWLGANPGGVDAMFLDIKMPGMDGLQVAGKIAEEIPIVFVTGWREFALQAWDLAVLDYLEKPLTPYHVGRVVARLENLLRETKYTGGVPLVLLRAGKARAEEMPLTSVEYFEVSDREVRARVAEEMREVIGMRSLQEVALAFPREEFAHVGRNRLVRTTVQG
jgi:DNA-binding LytR/AlgR family response regulator